MSRKRDTNWTRDEITVLLDSIMEITQGLVEGGPRRTNSREVFEYAAKKLGEKGHAARAEREKCRTKWKKMKEEFNHAKRARDTGEGRIAPGIEPFYSRMLEFINGSFDNISPHSTIVRRSSSISSNNNNNNNNNNISNNNNNNNNNNINNNNHNTKNGNSNNHNNGNSSSSSTTTSNNGIVTINNNNNHNGIDGVVHHPSNAPTNSSRFSQGASRASARIAANSNGVSSNDASDTSNTIATRQNNVDYSTAALTFTPSDSSLTSSSRQLLQRPSPVDMNGSSMTLMSVVTNRSHLSSSSLNGSAELNHRESSSSGEQVKITVDCDSVSRNENPSQTQNPNANNNPTLTNNHNNSSSDLTNQLQPADRDADISYRVSSGYRQITIFGDLDVDIKFRGDCVTINKISADHSMNNSDT